jgi:hypothetical protein
MAEELCWCDERRCTGCAERAVAVVALEDLIPEQRRWPEHVPR